MGNEIPIDRETDIVNRILKYFTDEDKDIIDDLTRDDTKETE